MINASKKVSCVGSSLTVTHPLNCLDCSCYIAGLKAGRRLQAEEDMEQISEMKEKLEIESVRMLKVGIFKCRCGLKFDTEEDYILHGRLCGE